MASYNNSDTANLNEYNLGCIEGFTLAKEGKTLEDILTQVEGIERKNGIKKGFQRYLSEASADVDESMDEYNEEPTLDSFKKVVEKVQKLKALGVSRISDESLNKALEIVDVSRNEKHRQEKMAEKAVSGSGNKIGIKTFAILTAQNPLTSDTRDNSYNKHKNKDFTNDLKAYGFSFIPIYGMYENPENSYFVFNPRLEAIKTFAKRYDQSSFIFGECNEDGFEATMWELTHPKQHYSAVKNVFEPKSTVSEAIDASDLKDIFSKIGNKFKFQFPFQFSDSLNSKFLDNMSRMTDSDIDIAFKGMGASAAYRYKALHKGIQEYIDSLQ